MKKFFSILIISMFIGVGAASANEVIITLASLTDGETYDNKPTCSLEFSITNNAYGTIHKIQGELTAWDDRDTELEASGFSGSASNSGGMFSGYKKIEVGATVHNVGKATFKEKCKYFGKLKLNGIDEDDCAMRMLPEDVSCVDFTVLKSAIDAVEVVE